MRTRASAGGWRACQAASQPASHSSRPSEPGLPPFVAATIAIGFLALATGGLHEDGLADTADGFGGGRTRDEKLAIMRDSRIGTYGVLALVFSVLIRAMALASIFSPDYAAGALPLL